MANLPENNVWDPVYQLEETDPVQGGPNGIDNLQGKQLANRTLYLKLLVDALGTGKVDQSALATQADAIAGADNTKWMTPLRVAQAISALASIAAATETLAGKVELATNAETITGTDTQRATHPAGVKAAINAAVAALVNSSPTTLDTLNELAAALGNDPNFATTITALIAGKQPLDATLTALSGLTTAANQILYSTGADAFAMATLTPFARTLLDDADAAAVMATLGMGAGASSFGTNGYFKLPDWLGGFMFQWGVVILTGGGSYTTVTLPITYPVSNFGVFGNAVENYGGVSAESIEFGARGLSSFEVISLNGASPHNSKVSWFSIGR